MPVKTSMRRANREDYPFILALNAANVEVLSPMDEGRADHFSEIADLFEIAEIDGRPAAFLIAIREGKDYDSENYLWFRSHYAHFLYVDRIVIASEYRGQGIGKEIYTHVLEHARKTGVPFVTAEIDTAPVYNEASLRFHEAMGFQEVGTQQIRGGTVTVSLQALALASA